MNRGALRLVLLAATLAVAGCTTGAAPKSGSGTGTPGGSPGTPSGSTGSPTATYSVSTSPASLVLQFATSGGLIPPGYLLTETPHFALFGDGRVIVPGPMIEIYPGPLLPNLRQMQLTPPEVQRILAAADAAGLLGADARYDAEGIADAATTTFKITVAGKTHTISAYALGIGGTVESDTVRRARERLVTFEQQMANLGLLLGRTLDDTAYAPQSMRVFTVAAGSSGTQTPAPQVVAWPLAIDPATAGQPIQGAGRRCIVLSGSDLASFLKVAVTANALTVWKAPSGSFNVSVRPLYPNESGCPTAGF